MATWAGWADDVLRAGGWPVSAANVRFLTEWQRYEQSSCRFNPLNTIQPELGSTTCNSFTSGGVTYHVQNYLTAGSGAAATVKTLKNGRYAALVSALASGDPFGYAFPQTVAADITTWGTPNYAADYLREAGSSTPSPTITPTQAAGAGLETRVTADHGWSSLMRAMSRTAPKNIRYTHTMRHGIRRLTRVGR